MAKYFNNTNAIWGQLDQPKTNNNNITYHGDYHTFDDIDTSKITDEVLVWHKPEFPKKTWQYGLYGIKNCKDNNYVKEEGVVTIELQKKYCFIIYGQFRNYKENLENNLKNIYNTIIKNNIIDVYILTSKNNSEKGWKNIDGNYSKENENDIINIFKKYNCNVQLIDYWDNYISYNNIGKQNQLEYNNICELDPDHIHKGSNSNVADIWYRMYITNLLKNKYCIDNNKIYDLHIFIRLFDTIIYPIETTNIVKNKLKSAINEDILLCIVDLLFIGNKNIIDKLFNIGKNFQEYMIYNKVSDDFINEYKNIIFYQHHPLHDLKYCSEYIVFNYIYNNIKYINLALYFLNRHACYTDSLNSIWLNKTKIS